MQLDLVFSALASNPRRRILAYLSEAELTTSDLAQKFEMSAPTVSRHLSVLESAGLVNSDRRGQYVYYRLNRDAVVNSLASYAFELCPTARPLKRESRRVAQAARAMHKPASR